MTNRIEKGIETIAAGIMGAVKATKGKLVGLTGVFEHLAREHGEVTALLLRLKASSDPELRSTLFPKIRAELLSHEKGELAEVFPVFGRFEPLAPLAERHNADAGKLEALLDALTSIPYTDGLWTRRFGELVASVDRHTMEEENEFFPQASKLLGRETTEKMLPRFEAAKRKAMKSLGDPAKASPSKPEGARRAPKRKAATTFAARAVPRVATGKGAKKASPRAAKKASPRAAKKAAPRVKQKSSARR
jgi:hypothetical protein